MCVYSNKKKMKMSCRPVPRKIEINGACALLHHAYHFGGTKSQILRIARARCDSSMTHLRFCLDQSCDFANFGGNRDANIAHHDFFCEKVVFCGSCASPRLDHESCDFVPPKSCTHDVSAHVHAPLTLWRPGHLHWSPTQYTNTWIPKENNLRIGLLLSCPLAELIDRRLVGKIRTSSAT